jgi:GDPmannose 4,6-dehydratase
MRQLKKLLVFGGTGQTGSYLCSAALTSGFNVYCASRDIQSANISIHDRLNIADSVCYESVDYSNSASISRLISRISPTHIAFLGGQTSVGLSFDQPSETMMSNYNSVLYILECLRELNSSIRFFHASSSEVFGSSPLGTKFNESSPHCPLSPYAVAKSSATNVVRIYREAYGLPAFSGFLSNHESIVRSPRFILSSLLLSIDNFKAGRIKKISLGSLNVLRDWGWAPEYADAILNLLSSDLAEDLIIATGKTTNLRDIVLSMLNLSGLDESCIELSQKIKRPLELTCSSLDPALIFNKLGWKASTSGIQVAQKLVSRQLY